ncbi:ATP-binding protein [Thermomonas alba]|uniref:ATP-binding protein n=1 Tax=Thermomonas alba TaxID=2888525 RepID=UPI001F039D3A|nr:ATP-binding protein [Thermomonas alba]
MRLTALRHSIRKQLLALFGLILVTGALALVLDQFQQYLAERALVAMRDDVLAGMRRIRRLSNAYEMDLVDTTFRTRNYLIDWQQAAATLARAQDTAAAEWQALQAMPLDPESRALVEQALRERVRADRALAELQDIVRRQDILALGRFADHELYPAVDPLVARLEQIQLRGQARADALVRQELHRSAWFGRARIGLLLLCFVLVALFGRRVLRNGYQGIESLIQLARDMARYDYTSLPRFRPRGELGEVMESFLHMREQVRRMEAQLTDQLARNDRARVELERREQFQRLLLEAAQTAIFVVDENGVFAQVNPFAEKLLGWPAGALVGRERLDAILDPEALGALARALSEAYGQAMPADWTALRALALHCEPPREFALRHRSGRTLPVLLALSAMRSDTGELLGLLGVAADLTQRKRLERALRDSEQRAHEASRAKSAFLAAMSHEIRTPMIGITGMLEVLGHTPLDPEQRRALEVIQTSADTMLRIIGDILDFSKIEAGRMALEPAPTDLAELVRSLAAGYSGAASAKGLVLECRIAEGLAPAYAVDPVRLRQIVGNFLSNAIKFTAQGRVTLSLGIDSSVADAGPLGSDALVVEVADTGIGISAQAQARLFQPFAQAEADTTRRFGGTGLGLAISRRLAELMGGRIEMESTPGKGTRIRLHLTLPRAPAEALAPPARLRLGRVVSRRPPSVAEAERQRRLILLVDDHATNREVIQRQLALAGYASETAADGLEGLQRWRSGRYALLLVDLHMPRMDGYALARALREEEARRGLPRTPIVALTAAALKGEAERCLAAGMDDYLAKPVGIAALGACLQRWLPHADAGARIEQTQDAGIHTEDGAQAKTGAATAAAQVLDAAVLAELGGNDPDAVRAILQDFLATTGDDLRALERLHEAGDLSALTRQAHKIKGAAALVGAQRLAAAAAALEAAGRSGDAARLPTLIADLRSAAQQLQQHVPTSPRG